MRDDGKHNLRGVICLPFDLLSLFCGARSHQQGWSVISPSRWSLSCLYYSCPVKELSGLSLHYSPGCDSNEWQMKGTWFGRDQHHLCWNMIVKLNLLFCPPISIWVRLMNIWSIKSSCFLQVKPHLCLMSNMHMDTCRAFCLYSVLISSLSLHVFSYCPHL